MVNITPVWPVVAGDVDVWGPKLRAGLDLMVNQGNSTDSALASKAALIHTHTSAQVSDFVEAAQDAVALMLTAGTAVTLSYNDAGGQLAISATGGGGVDMEAVRDALGIALVGVGAITIVPNDTLDTITFSTSATVNSTDAQLRDRSTHTGTQASTTISDFTPAVNALVTAAVNNVLNGAPGALNTLDELAAALGDDANFAASMTIALSERAMDTLAMHKAGAETITGPKTFATNPVFNDAAIPQAKVAGLVAALSAVTPVESSLAAITDPAGTAVVALTGRRFVEAVLEIVGAQHIYYQDATDDWTEPPGYGTVPVILHSLWSLEANSHPIPGLGEQDEWNAREV